MSITFYIANKKGLFGSKKVMSVKECLSLSSQKMEQFSFDETQDDFDVESFYNSLITDYECLLLGVANVSSRGFELFFEREMNAYAVRVFTPSTKKDWKLALSYLKELARKLGSDIVSESEERFTYETIEQFDYTKDILFGIKACLDCLKNDMGIYTMMGLFAKVSLDQQMVEYLFSFEDPAQKFSDLFESIQYIDAYVAKQMFYKDNNSHAIFGVYTLTQGVDTVLPYKPCVEFENQDVVQDEDIDKWIVSLCIIDGDPNDQNAYQTAGRLEYSDFIVRLPKEKYHFIDASQILVVGLSKEEILNLL